MLSAYKTGDAYLDFAKAAKFVPADATKQSHSAKRDLFKTCALGVLFGMEAEGLALRINKPPIFARQLLQWHRELYSTFWTWSDNSVARTILSGWQRTVFGWTNRLQGEFNPRSFRNFFMQSNAGEMLRLACCLGTERGIEVCAPVHDAVLICAPLDRLDDDVRRMQECMTEASIVVTGGLALKTDVKLIRHPRPIHRPTR